MFNMDKVSTKDFWWIFWNQDEEGRLHLMYEFIEQGTEILEKISGGKVLMDDVKNHMKMIIDDME